MNSATLAIIGALLAHGAAAAPEAPPLRSTSEIAALIDAAAPGSVVRVEPGTYHGALVVRKSVILDGGGDVVIDGDQRGDVVQILVGGVTFRGFTVRGSSAKIDGEPAGIRAEAGPVVVEHNTLRDVLFGIDLRTAPDSIVRHNDIEGKPLELGRRGDAIRLWWSAGCTVEDNSIRQSRDAVFWYSENIIVRRNHVEGSRYGLHFMYSHDTLLAENRLERNSVGVYLMYSNGIRLERNLLARNRGPSGYGMGLKDCDGVVCIENQLLANRVGVYVDNSPFSIGAEGRFDRNVLAFNEIGLAMTPNTRGNVFSGNGFVENQEQVAALGRGDLAANAFSRDGRGNFWSDYAGFDRDADGVGDLAYEAVSLFESLLAGEPNLRLFVHSPAQQAIEFTARALPSVRPEPKFVDAAPLMSPPQLASIVAPTGERGAMGLVAAGLLALGAAGVALGERAWTARVRGSEPINA